MDKIYEIFIMTLGMLLISYSIYSLWCIPSIARNTDHINDALKKICDELMRANDLAEKYHREQELKELKCKPNTR